jgi:hypothetical protein
MKQKKIDATNKKKGDAHLSNQLFHHNAFDVLNPRDFVLDLPKRCKVNARM